MLLDSVSRFSRFKSVRSSAADWQRVSRSFSNALLMIRSSSAGTSGFSPHRSYRRSIQYGFEHHCGRIASKRKCSGTHLVQNHTEREQVSAGVEFLASNCSGDI